MLKHTPPILVLACCITLMGCSQTHQSKADFSPSLAHLKPTEEAIHAVPSPKTPQQPISALSLPDSPPVLSQSHYYLNVIATPVRSLLQNIAIEAGIELDIEDSVTENISVQLNQTDPLILLQRICEQSHLLLEVVSEQSSKAKAHYRVRSDMPFWVHHKLDYVNLERQLSSSLMVANALGSIAGRSTQSVTLGGQNNPPVAVSQGSSTALLNQSKFDLWNNLSQQLTLLLRAKHPELLLPNATTTSSTPSTEATSPAKTPPKSSENTAENTTVSSISESLQQHQDNPPELSSRRYPIGTAAKDVIHLNREGGFISLYAPQRTQTEIAQFLEQIQSSIHRQVLIEATILEVELNDEHQTGINWQALIDGQGLNISSAFTGRDQNDFTSSQSAGLVTMTGSAISKDFSLTGTLKLLERYGQSRVLSSPKIMTLNHQASLIKVVKNLVYFTMQAQVVAGQTGQSSTRAYVSTPNTVPIGLVMSVIPSIGDNQQITLAIRPTISSLSGVVDDPNPDLGEIPNRVPIIQERELESVLTLNNGQVAILGGLIQDVMAEEETGIPLLQQQDSFGFLFGQKNKAKRKSELLIFLKPTLMPTKT